MSTPCISPAAAASLIRAELKSHSPGDGTATPRDGGRTVTFLSPAFVLQETGILLYGPHFLTPLSLSLHCPRNPHPGVNYDNLRMWVKGTRLIPSWVWGELGRLIQERREDLSEVEKKVDKLRLTSSIDIEK